MAGKIELVLTAEFKEAYKKLPQDIKKKVKNSFIICRTIRHTLHFRFTSSTTNGNFMLIFFIGAFF
jgi:hypothetical protein